MKAQWSEDLRALWPRVAVVVKTPLVQILASVFLGLEKPTMPMRVFDQEEAAVAWLREVAA